MADQDQEIVQIRTYHFKYGTLHLERATAESMADEGVIEEYTGKGELLKAFNDEMGAEDFFGLEDFREI